MATRSTIAVELADKTIREVYCHWDGGLWENGVGDTLLQHYDSQALAEEVTSLGDMSKLEACLYPTDPTHSFDKPEPGIAVFYGRDRGETGVSPKVYADYATYLKIGDHQDYDYLYRNGEWQVRRSGYKRYTNLREIFKKVNG